MCFLRNGPLGKARPCNAGICIKWHMKDNVEVIHFQMKMLGRASLFFFRKMTFEMCTTNFHYDNGEVDKKATISNL